MTRPTVHIIGAGLAGLCAAVTLTKAGHAVRLYEAAGHAGGRCRSFFDETLGCRIDNGNHLLLSGNWAVERYLSDIGAEQPLVGPERAEFPFVDIESGERWVVRPDRGVIPWSLMTAKGRVPGTGLGDYLRGLKLAFASNTATIDDCLGPGTALYRRFWEPLALGVLNTPLDRASARLLWPVIKETFGRGEAACRPRVAREGLSESFVDPALAYLERAGVTVAHGNRLRRVGLSDGRVHELDFAGNAGRVAVGAKDRVISALPPWVLSGLLPDLALPEGAHAIVNVHYRVPPERFGNRPNDLITGVVGGIVQWIFTRGDIVSVTVSAADALAGKSAGDIAEKVWTEIQSAFYDATPNVRSANIPPFRVVKEKRATFSQTPEQIAKRPGVKTDWRNLFLAGDWTDTGLPATIEGTLRSGHIAARSVEQTMADP